MCHMNKRVVRVIFQLVLMVLLVPISGLVIFGCLFTLKIVSPPPKYPINASQFNIPHSFLPNDIADNFIIPNQVGNFTLDASDYSSPYPNSQRHLNANYGNIRLSLYLVTDSVLRERFISEEVRCNEYGNSTHIQGENGITYIYSYCSVLGYTALSLLWENGDWVLKAWMASTAWTASTERGYADLLVEFVNNYPF
jgi:hypothetical protein